MKRTKTIAVLLGVLVLSVTQAREGGSKSFEIAPQPVSTALKAFAAQSDLQLIFTERDVGLARTGGVTGTLTPRAALAAILEGTGLEFEFTENNVVVVRRPALSSTGRAVPVSGNTEAATQMRLAQASGETQEEDKQSSAGSRKPREEEEKSGAMVVTGSRIATVSSQLAANVIVLSAEDLRATGESTLEKALRQLPQNMLGATEVGVAIPSGGGMSFNGALNLTGGSNINLRGLGSESTLVLVDGRRIGKSGIFGGATDISGIPLSSVERVEIMLDGASSVYGSDAVGGVVNIILRRDYRGIEATYEYGAPGEGGFDEHIITLSGGKTWESTRLRATFEHFKGSNLDGSERHERIFSTRSGSPAGVYANTLFYRYNGRNYLASQLAGLGLTTTSPGVQRVSFTQLPEGRDGTTPLSLQDFVPLESRPLGPGFFVDDGLGVSLIPATRRDSLQLGFDQDFHLGSMPVVFSGNLYYSDRSTYAGAGAMHSAFTLAANDPRNPFRTRTTIHWSIPSLGNTYFNTDQNVERGSLSLEGRLGSSWRWTLAASGSHDRIDSLNINGPDFPPAGINFLASDIVAANPPELLAQLVAEPAAIAAINEEMLGELNANGALFALPGGEVHLAAGLEWREESIASRAGETTIAQTAGDFNSSLPQLPYNTELSRIQQSGFAELLVPIVGQKNAMSGLRQLTLTGSGRFDSYTVYGNSTTWSAGLIYSPQEQVRFKANHSTSFVVPTPREGLADEEHLFSGEGEFGLALVDAFGLATGEVDYVGELIIGGNRKLKPENASSWSAGIEFRPDLIRGLMLDASWHRTSYRNRITEAPNLTLVSGTDYVAIYPNLERGPDGLLIWDARAVNAARVEVSGIDFTARYDLQTRLGEFALTGNIGYTDKYDQLSFEGGEVQSRLGAVKGTNIYIYGIVPRYRYSSTVSWYRGGWSMSLDGTTASDVSVRHRIVGQNLITISTNPMIANLLLSYDWDEAGVRGTGWLCGSKVSLKVLNILEDSRSTRQYVVETGQTFEAWYNANYADPRGRMFYLGLTKRF